MIEIQAIEQNKDATILHCTLHNLLIIKLVLVTRRYYKMHNQTKSFKLLRTDSVKTKMEQIWMPQSGSKFLFYILNR